MNIPLFFPFFFLGTYDGAMRYTPIFASNHPGRHYFFFFLNPCTLLLPLPPNEDFFLAFFCFPIPDRTTPRLHLHLRHCMMTWCAIATMPSRLPGSGIHGTLLIPADVARLLQCGFSCVAPASQSIMSFITFTSIGSRLENRPSLALSSLLPRQLLQV